MHHTHTAIITSLATAACLTAAFITLQPNRANAQPQPATPSTNQSTPLDVPLHRIAWCDAAKLVEELMNTPEFTAQRDTFNANQSRLTGEAKREATRARLQDRTSEAAEHAMANAIRTDRVSRTDVGLFQSAQLKEAVKRLRTAANTIAERERYAYVITGKQDLDLLSSDTHILYLSVGQVGILAAPPGTNITAKIRQELNLPEPAPAPKLDEAPPTTIR